MDEQYPQPTSTVEERTIIKKLMDAPMEEGATWYLLSYKWHALTPALLGHHPLFDHTLSSRCCVCVCVMYTVLCIHSWNVPSPRSLIVPLLIIFSLQVVLVA